MIEGIKIKLRVLELDDANIIYKNWNNLELRSFLGSRKPASLDDEKDYVRSTWDNNKKGQLALGIELLGSKKLIGTIGAWPLWQFSGSYELGIAIWELKERSKGYGTEAIQLLLFYAFEIMNAHRMQLHVVSFNKRGIKAYSKVGFKEVGRLRQADYIYNKYNDMVIMDLLKDEMEYPDELNNKLNEYRNSID